MIPGSNILKMALRVIARQSLTYFKANGRILNDVGQYVTTYDTSQLIVGSFQPVPQRLYQQYGLDFNKSHFTFYVPENVIAVDRDISGDQVGFKSQRYQCESVTPWFSLDGWNEVLCVEISS